MTRRAPKKQHGFSWGRFRRDHRGVVHMLAVDFRAGMERAELARRLRVARRALRDQVDEIDLRAWGIAA